jgi:hypothetical protein
MDRSRSETIPFATKSEDGTPSLRKIGIPHVSYWQLPDEDGYTYSAKYQAQIDEKGATSQVLVNRVAGLSGEGRFVVFGPAWQSGF